MAQLFVKFFELRVRYLRFNHFNLRVKGAVVVQQGVVGTVTLVYVTCGMVRYGMVWYGMRCYAMLCYAMLCHAMLCYAMLCYAMM